MPDFPVAFHALCERPGRFDVDPGTQVERPVLKGAAPPGVTTNMIYRGVVPFIAVQVIAIVVMFVMPSLATWLPKAIGW